MTDEPLKEDGTVDTVLASVSPKNPVTIKALPKSELEITGSVDAATFDRAIARAVAGYVQDIELKGFRKGKAPEAMIVQAVGEAKILERAANLALGEVWGDVLETHDIDAIGSPSFSITKIARGNPLEWKARVAVMPDIELPSDYLKIAHNTFSKETKPVEVPEKEIDDAVGWIQKSRGDKEGNLPHVDDAFAQSLGNFPTVADLREHIRKNIADELTMKERERVRVAILEKIREKSTMEIPDVLIASEVERMLVDLKSMVTRMGQKWEDYVTNTGTSEEKMRDGMKEDAARRVAFGLVLRAVAKSASIAPTEEEIAERMGKLYEPHTHEDGTVHDAPHDVDTARDEEYAKGVLMNEKVFALLEGKTS